MAGCCKMLAERLQVNARSNRLLQDPREQCCRSLDTGGVCTSAANVGGTNANHLSSAVHRCSPVRLAEYADNAAQRPQSTVSKCHVDEANVRQGFWKNEVAIPSSVEHRAVEAAAQNQESENYLPSTFHHQVDSDFTKAAAPKELSKASKLSAQIEFDIQEIERLKAQMALLCERLACHISRWNKDPCKAAVSDRLDSDESLLLEGLEELKRVIGVPTGRSESLREHLGKEDVEAEYHIEGPETEDHISGCRNLTWKRGIGTLFQSILWCIGFMMTVVRGTQYYSGPELIPT